MSFKFKFGYLIFSDIPIKFCKSQGDKQPADLPQKIIE